MARQINLRTRSLGPKSRSVLRPLRCSDTRSSSESLAFRIGGEASPPTPLAKGEKTVAPAALPIEFASIANVKEAQTPNLGGLMSELSDTVHLYGVLCDQADSISRSRRETSQFYVALHLAASSALGWSLAHATTAPHIIPLLPYLCLAMLVLCGFWFSMLTYFARLNEFKFKAILQLEKDLPVHALQEEWNDHRSGFRLSASQLEKAVPLLFALGYLIFAAASSWSEIMVLYQSILDR